MFAIRATTPGLVRQRCPQCGDIVTHWFHRVLHIRTTQTQQFQIQPQPAIKTQGGVHRVLGNQDMGQHSKHLRITINADGDT